MSADARFPQALIALLRQAVAAMGAYQGQAVLVGGLAPFVYQHHDPQSSGHGHVRRRRGSRSGNR